MTKPIVTSAPQPFVGATILKGIAGAVVKEAIKNVLARSEVPVPEAKVQETTNKVVAERRFHQTRNRRAR